MRRLKILETVSLWGERHVSLPLIGLLNHVPQVLILISMYPGRFITSNFGKIVMEAVSFTVLLIIGSNSCCCSADLSPTGAPCLVSHWPMLVSRYSRLSLVDAGGVSSVVG